MASAISSSQTPYAYEKAHAWSSHKQEYVKRAAFTMIAYLTYRDKTAPDADILQFLPVIRREAGDERNFVKKAVNWALRNIGKRNRRCNAAAIKCAEQIRADGTRSGRWIAADALRELRGDAVQARLKRLSLRCGRQRCIVQHDLQAGLAVRLRAPPRRLWRRMTRLRRGQPAADSRRHADGPLSPETTPGRRRSAQPVDVH